MAIGLSVTAAAVAVLFAGTSHANPEPNDNVAQAVGPLTGATYYQGQIETSNDEDWFFFYTSGQRQFDLAGTNLSSNSGRCEEVTFYLTDADGRILSGVDPWLNVTEHITYTSKRAAKFYVQVTGSGCDPAGSPPVSYQLRVDPQDALASALAPAGPSTPSRACRAAQARERRLARTVRRLRKKLAQARSPQSRRRYRRLLRKRKRELLRAKRAARAAC